jgi:endo-1,4-beta-D-glucanase Y
MTKYSICITIAFFLSGICLAQVPTPGMSMYMPGVIKPNHKTTQQLNNELGTVYNRWKKNYLKPVTGTTDQYFIRCRKDRPETVSEGHGYGMVTVAYMAWYDTSAQTYFNGLLRFSKANPSGANNRLMNWQENIDNYKPGSPHGSSATDGDMDIAYSLLLADRLWGSKGQFNYKAEALSIINAMTESIVHTKYKTLKMGDWARREGMRRNDGTRPSDFMLQHMRAYQQASGNVLWTAVIDSTYRVVSNIFTKYSPKTGLMPDFAERKGDEFVPAIGKLLEDAVDGSDSFNSSRVPWRLGTDYIVAGDKRAYDVLTVTNRWIKESSLGNPDKIGSGYLLDGKFLPDRDYADLAFQSPFMVSAMIDKSNQKWLNALWDNAVVKHDSYFGDSITMLCMIVASGNWWKP